MIGSLLFSEKFDFRKPLVGYIILFSPRWNTAIETSDALHPHRHSRQAWHPKPDHCPWWMSIPLCAMKSRVQIEIIGLKFRSSAREESMIQYQYCAALTRIFPLSLGYAAH